MHDFLMWAGGIIVSGVFALIGWVITMIFSKIDTQRTDHDNLETRFDAHRLEAAQTFATQNYVKEAKNEIVRMLERIEDKIDQKR